MTTVLSKTAIVLVMLHLLVGGQALDFESVGEKIMKKIGKLDFPQHIEWKTIWVCFYFIGVIIVQAHNKSIFTRQEQTKCQTASLKY